MVDFQYYHTTIEKLKHVYGEVLNLKVLLIRKGVGMMNST